MSSGRDVRVLEMNNAAQAISVGFSANILDSNAWKMEIEPEAYAEEDRINMLIRDI